MPYEGLIGALIEEGESKCREILGKARVEADRVITEARAGAAVLERDADAEIHRELIKQRTKILGRATLSERQALLRAHQEVLQAVWRRSTETCLALRGDARRRVLDGIFDELLASAPPGPFKVVMHPSDLPLLESRLTSLGISFEQEERDDLMMGIELVAEGECLRSTLRSRMMKARPDLAIELKRLLFDHGSELSAVGNEPEAER